jgi:hypothetical protein
LFSGGITRVVAADGRRKHVERQAVAAAIDVRPGLDWLLIRTILTVEAPGLAITARAPRCAVLAFVPVLAFVAFGRFRLVRLHHLFVAVVVVHVLVARATGILVFEPRPALAQHAKIMVGELEIIFGLDAVARELRVARHAFVFFE